MMIARALYKKPVKVLLLFVFLVGFAHLFALIPSEEASAEGETFRWLDANTIEMSGGNYGDLLVDDETGHNQRPLRFEGNPQSGTYQSNRSLSLDGATGACSFFLTIVLDRYSDSNNLNAPSYAMPHEGTLQHDISREGPHDRCLEEADGHGYLVALTRFWTGNRCEPRSSNPCTPSAVPTSSSIVIEDIATAFPQLEACSGVAEDDVVPCIRSTIRENGGLENMEHGEPAPPEEEAPGADSDVVCAGGAFGWLLCPLTETLMGTTNLIAGIMETFLRINPLEVNNDEDPTFVIWSAMRNLANIIFIIYFLIIIFSYVTSVGISQYGIKRTLPRVLIAAILTNTSFYIAAVLIDIFNIIGGSVEGIFQIGINAAAEAIEGDAAQELESAGGLQWGLFAAAIGVLVTLLGGVIYAAGAEVIWLLAPPLVALFAAILSVFVLLLLRQLAILILIILSPILVVTWLMPGTETYFTKSMNMFIGLLATYPIVIAITQASSLLVAILIATQSDRSTPFADWWLPLVIIIVLIAGIVAVFAVVRYTLKLLNTLGLSGIGASLGSFARKQAQGLSSRGWERSRAGKRLKGRQQRLDTKAEGKFAREQNAIRQGSRGGVRGAIDTMTGAQRRRQSWDEQMAESSNQQSELKRAQTEHIADALSKASELRRARTAYNSIKNTSASDTDKQKAKAAYENADAALKATGVSEEFLDNYAGSAAGATTRATAGAISEQAKTEKTEVDNAAVVLQDANSKAIANGDGSLLMRVASGQEEGYQDAPSMIAAQNKLIEQGNAAGLQKSLNAVHNYRKNLKDSGASDKEANQKANEFADRQVSNIVENHSAAQGVLFASADSGVRSKIKQQANGGSAFSEDGKDIHEATAKRLNEKASAENIVSRDKDDLENIKGAGRLFEQAIEEPDEAKLQKLGVVKEEDGRDINKAVARAQNTLNRIQEESRKIQASDTLKTKPKAAEAPRIDNLANGNFDEDPT